MPGSDDPQTASHTPSAANPESDRAVLIQAGLVLVATPIGNLADISARALGVLREADLILCEDTRLTARLLGHYGISTRTSSGWR